MVAAIAKRGEPLQFRGMMLPDGRRAPGAPPLRDLDRTPVPDFSDFPWDRYRLRVVPIMTGRGCQWAQCTFCSDVLSASGRTFRTRSLDSVMAELREQSRRHETRNFLFLDIKLNSNPAMFRGIAASIQDHVPGAEWIGTVHVDRRADNGLSRDDLRRAAAAGMRRISFGLESGSQRLLDAMRKGSDVEANGAFIRNAHEAGISVRCTMFKGYPGETADDMRQTADFLERHAAFIDRVRFNRLSLHEGTSVHQAATSEAGVPSLELRGADPRNGRAVYVERRTDGWTYRRELMRALAVVHAINRKPLRGAAGPFDGLM